MSSGSIPQHFIEQLLERTDIATLINERVPLKQSGNDYWACCPFHDEKTASFSVSARKNFYYCFGCGAKGNAINFLQQFDHLSFVEAIESLAARAGLEVPRSQQNVAKVLAERGLQQAAEFAGTFYREQFFSHPLAKVAREYLALRGVDEKTAERFQIGFAPPGRRALGEACDAPTQKALTELKLLAKGYDGRINDLFHHRLMFPIRNRRGKVLGFGGRTLGDEKSKYINSPESEIFHKSQLLYGLYEASQLSRQLDSLIVVEGYLDVVSLSQFGIHNAVATLGTATNEESLKTLLSQCASVTFCFDGDAAGDRAAQRAMENALPLLNDGVSFKFLLLPGGEDPDSLVRKAGAEDFRKRIDNARPLSSYFFDICARGIDLSQPEGKGLLKERAEKALEKIPSYTIANAMKAELRELTRPPQRIFNKKNSGPKTGPAGLITTFTANERKHPQYYKVAKPDDAQQALGSRICLALYYRPNRSEEFANRIESVNLKTEIPDTLAFCHYLTTHRLQSREALLRNLSESPDAQIQFHALFNGLDIIPEDSVAQQEANGELNQLLMRQTEKRIAELLKLNNMTQVSGTDEDHFARLQQLHEMKSALYQCIKDGRLWSPN